MEVEHQIQQQKLHIHLRTGIQQQMEVEQKYKTDEPVFGAMYITPFGTLIDCSMFPNGHADVSAWLNEKGLEILGVSLDSDREKWVAAIEKNGLAWHHVSSLSQFDCPIAKRFRVTGIPRMYILDESGKIIAQDLRGEALKEKVEEMFKGEMYNE